MDKKDSKTFLKNIGSVSIGISISRILGYIRDMLIAQLLGASLFADTFYAAYRIPNLFRRLFGEGSVSGAFVPVFTEYIETKTHKESQELLNIVFTTLLTILLIITILGIIFAKPITYIIASGFKTTPEKMQLTVTLTKIMFPYLIFVCLAALMMGTLNSLKKFFLSAVSSSFLNLSEILYVIFFAGLITLPQNQVKFLGVSVVIGGIGQYIAQQIGIWKNGIKTQLKYNFKHPGLTKIFKLILPMMFGFSIDQINVFINTIFASFLEHGSITILYYANRLTQLPLALFGIAVTTVALPVMSTNIARNEIEKMKSTLNFSLKTAMLYLIPCMVGFIIMGKPIIKLLFERGKFDSVASLKTYYTLIFYVTGLLSLSFSGLFASTFYSFKKTKLPVKIAFVSLISNLIFIVLFIKPLKIYGLALSSSLSSWINTFLLGFFLNKKICKIGFRNIFITFSKILVASIIMGVIIYIFNLFNYCLILKVPITIILGMLSYFLSVKLLKIER